LPDVGRVMALAQLFVLLAVGTLGAQETNFGVQELSSDSDNGSEGALSSVRYLLRDPTGKAASKLHADWDYQVKGAHDGSRSDDLFETFGEPHHRFKLNQMGFDLLEVDEGGGFMGRGYHDPDQLHKAFKKLSEKYPKNARLMDLTAEYKQPKTVKGRSLYAIKLSQNAAVDESKPNILVVSNHHARELITPELVLTYATNLLKDYAKGEELDESGDLGESLSEQEHAEIRDAQNILKKNQVYMMWTMNPDGLHNVWTKNSWQRTNANNVDLNRNYPVGWKLSCGGSANSGGETWRGPKPFSESETKTMRAMQVNRNFAKVMDFHSYAEQVRTNYGNCAKLPGGLDKKFEAVRDGIAGKMNYQASRSCCMGGNIHYAYNQHGSLAYLVETGTAFQPSAAEKDKTVKRVWPGLKKFMQQPIAVSGIVTDKTSGKPLRAELKLPEFKFTQGEKLSSGERGHYHLWLPAGKHKVEVHAPNKPVKTVTVEAKDAGNVHHIKV